MGNLDALRQALREERRRIHGEKRFVLSSRAAQFALNFITKKDHIHSIGVFSSLNEEIDTMPLIHSLWQKGYTLYLPVIKENNLLLKWCEYHPRTPLNLNKLGILTPTSGKISNMLCGVPDLTIMPLVGFDHRGNRLGMGGGFYDRTFCNKINNQPPWLLGLAYACQETPELLRRAWDIPMDAIATEQELLHFI